MLNLPGICPICGSKMSFGEYGWACPNGCRQMAYSATYTFPTGQDILRAQDALQGALNDLTHGIFQQDEPVHVENARKKIRAALDLLEVDKQ